MSREDEELFRKLSDKELFESTHEYQGRDAQHRLAAWEIFRRQAQFQKENLRLQSRIDRMTFWIFVLTSILLALGLVQFYLALLWH